MNRYCILIAGESGSGLVTTGDILINSLIDQGFYVVADREYPSLIKGGYACYRIQFSDQPISGMSEKNDLLLCVDRMGVKHYIDHLDEGGIVVQGDERHDLVEHVVKTIEKKKLINIYLPERKTVFGIGGNLLMTNILMLGVTWRVLGLPYASVEEEVTKRFASKPAILKLDLKCLEIGYNHEISIQNSIKLWVKTGNNTTHTNVYDGNEAVALGAVQGGMTNYYAYPMSPSSSILTYVSKLAHKHNITIKQGEDEISVVQMTLGSMHVGARSLCATSGGGFDLMTETVSLAALIETPLVIVNVQRPGPATGLPTWTAQADLELAAYAGHGEYARMVYAISDPEHAYYGIVEAMNYAEIFQIPVIVLSDKCIAETNITLPEYDRSKIQIHRGITDGSKIQSSQERYSLDEPISKRWLPGSSDHVYFANGDEHREDGTLTEDETECQNMFDRRRTRIELLEDALPEPEILGPEKADISFVGWGSTKMVMRDVLELCKEEGISVNYLHYNVVFPIEKIQTKQFFKNNTNINLIEGNMTGQLGKLIEQMGLKFRNKLLKYNGRAFFVEEIMKYIQSNNR